MAKNPTNQPANHGQHIILNGQRVVLKQHPTDFSVVAAPSAIDDKQLKKAARADRLSDTMTRMSAEDAPSRDKLMDEVRKQRVAHHIYSVADTDEEIIIDDRIIVELRNENPDEIEAITREYHLEPAGRMGSAHIFRVTEATGMNPVKTANAIGERDQVASCAPQVLVPMVRHQTTFAETHHLFHRQWYLTSDLITHPDLDPSVGIEAPEAWAITRGSEQIVIAVIDDGFDLGHPVFQNKIIHPDQKDFAVAPTDNVPLAGRQDFHGTCVASIATGSGEGGGMMGIAPGCTFLPIRIGFGPVAPPIDILDVFRYVSQRADVVNCSFGTPPRSFDPFPSSFRNEMTQLTVSGGRRGLGLVMVFSAANDDGPTFLQGSSNLNGVKYVSNGRIREVPKHRTVFSGYPLTRGVIVVGAMSSLKRKSGYSCWGPHLTVTAPSNNMHYITSFIPPGQNDAVRDQFVANYRGLGQVAATNRPGHGDDFSPLQDDPATTGFREDFYTARFGGTSGAAPVVSGVAALMLSVNPNLTADEVRQILMSTADRDLDSTLDLANDPNLQGLTGEFVMGRSLFFGAGKVNAFRAVQRARALLDEGPELTPTFGGAWTDGRGLSAISLDNLRVQSLTIPESIVDASGLRRWTVAGPHYGASTHGPARLFSFDADGRVLREYRQVSASFEPSHVLAAGEFMIRIAMYPQQVSHAPNYTELVVNSAGSDTQDRWFVLLSETPRPDIAAVESRRRPQGRVLATESRPAQFVKQKAPVTPEVAVIG